MENRLGFDRFLPRRFGVAVTVPASLSRTCWSQRAVNLMMPLGCRVVRFLAALRRARADTTDPFGLSVHDGRAAPVPPGPEPHACEGEVWPLHAGWTSTAPMSEPSA